MAWIVFDNNRLRINNEEIRQEQGECLIFAENLTKNIRTRKITYIPNEDERRSPFPQAIDISSGLNKIVLSVGNKKKEFYYYKPREGGAHYRISITQKIVEGKDYKDPDKIQRLLLLKIKSDVTLPVNRLYYKVKGFPMNFSFNQIEAGRTVYYSLTCPDDNRVEFYIDQPNIPADAVCYPSKNDIEYGIAVTSEEVKDDVI